MISAFRVAAILVLSSVAGAPAVAFAGETPQRLGRTIVGHKGGPLEVFLSWQDANDHFRKEGWLLLDVAVAPKKDAVLLRRADVKLVLPGGTRVSLATAERFYATTESRPERLVPTTRGGVEYRDPLEGFFRSPAERNGAAHWHSRSFFRRGPDGTIPEEIEAGPWDPFRGWLHFEAPEGGWLEGSYTLVLGSIGVELPFTLPADDPKKASGTARQASPGP